MMGINTLLSQCSSDKLDLRVEAYRGLTERFSSKSSPSCEISADLNSKLAVKIVSNLINDVLNSDAKVSFEALGFLGFYVESEKLMDLLTCKEEQAIVDSLIKILCETKDKDVLTRCLWTLSQSTFECEIYKKNCEKLLNSIVDILSLDPSNVISFECLNVIKMLIETVNEDVLKRIDVWYPKVFSCLFHSVSKVRTVAYNCFNLYAPQKDGVLAPVIHEHIKTSIPQLKSEYCKRMLKLFDENCTIILSIWRFLVSSLGISLHSDMQLINKLLEVVEKAFKSSLPESKVEAFKCWLVLINNFSQNAKVLTHSKRLKLLAAPLKTDNARTEDIAYIKLHTWWLLIGKVSENIEDYFDILILPLLKFCFNPNKFLQANASERAIFMSATSTPCIKYSNLVTKCVEVLSYILTAGLTQPENFSKFSLTGCPSAALTTTQFLRNFNIFLGCVADALWTLDSCQETQFEYGVIILQSLLIRVNYVVSQNPNKPDSKDLVKDFFKFISFLESQSKPGDSMSLFTYKLIELTALGKFAFSENILNSRMYHIPVGCNIKDMMNGTLFNYLIHQLCRPAILHYVKNPRFMDVWSNILADYKSTSKLIFLESVIGEMEEASVYLSDYNFLINLWIPFAEQVEHHMDEIQQTDNAEQDWSFIFDALLFPIENVAEPDTHDSPKQLRGMYSMWSKLWQHVVVLTSISTSAEPNFEAEYVGKKMLASIQTRLAKQNDGADDHGLYFNVMSQVLFTMMDHFRFKDLTKKSKLMKQSPLKPKKFHPMFNLKSCVALIELMTKKTLGMTSPWRHQVMQNLCLALTKIFGNITQDKIIWEIIFFLLDVLRKAVQVNPCALFDSETERAVIAMWASFCELLETRILPKLTKDQLPHLSPVLIVALRSSNTNIKHRTKMMWMTCLGNTKLPIPSSLFEVLETLGLPPASVSEAVVQESQSLSPKENIPTHISGSFLNREKNKKTPVKSLKFLDDNFANSSPEMKVETPPADKREKGTTSSSSSKQVKLSSKSPATSEKGLAFRTPNRKQNKTPKFGIDELKDEEFVKISSPKLSKRVLTPHQMEKFQERAVDIPALYNDMSQSCSQMTPQFDSQNPVMVLSSKEETKSSSTKLDLSFDGKIVKGKKELNFTSSLGPVPSVDKASTPLSAENQDEYQFQFRKFGFSVKSSNGQSDLPSTDPVTCDLSSEGNKDEKVGTKSGGKSDNNAKEAHSDSLSCKRKSIPTKKSLDDIKNSLRGTPKARRGSLDKMHFKVNSKDAVSKNSSSNLKQNNSPLAKPLISPHTSQNFTSKKFLQEKNANKNKFTIKQYNNKGISDLDEKDNGELHNGELCPSESVEVPSESRNTEIDLENESEEIIPNSQINTTGSSSSTVLLCPFRSPVSSLSKKAKHVDTPKSSDKPKRNKRKILFDDHVYESPAKRAKRGLATEKSPKSPLSSKSSRVKKTRKKRSLDAWAISYDSNGKPFVSSPSKITRSGRRIIPPVKHRQDTFELDTSPVKSKRSTKQSPSKSSQSPKLEKFNNSLSCTSDSDNDNLTLFQIKHSQQTKINVEKLKNSPNLNNASRTNGSNDDSALVQIQHSQPTQTNVEEMTTSSSNKTSSTSDGKYIVLKSVNSPSNLKSPGNVIVSVNPSRSTTFRCKIYNTASLKPKQFSSCDTIVISDDDISTSPNDKNLKETVDSTNKHKLDSLENNGECVLNEMNIADEDKISENENPKPTLTSPSKSDTDSDEIDITESTLNSPVANVGLGLSSENVNGVSGKCKLNDSSLNETKYFEELSSSCALKVSLRKLSDEDITKYVITGGSTKLYVSNTPRSKSPLKYSIKSPRSVLNLVEQSKNNVQVPSKLLVVTKDLSSQLSECAVERKKVDDTQDSGLQCIGKEANNVDLDGGLVELSNVVSTKENTVDIIGELLQKESPTCGDVIDVDFAKEDNENDVVNIESPSKCETSVVNSNANLTDPSVESTEIKEETNKEEPKLEDISCSTKTDLLSSKTCKESPDKESKLSLTVSTPERNKLSAKKVQIPGSRAAMMIACAKKTMKNRADETASDSPGSHRSQASENGTGDSPGITPTGKRSINDVYANGKPWVKHAPSPGASPCGSILKKKPASEEDTVPSNCEDANSVESSPCAPKSRRVSFADPPVSESVEIPPSPKVVRQHRAQKRLDMSPAFSEPKADSEETQESESMDVSNCSQPLYSPLVECQDSIDRLAPFLTSVSLVDTLKVVFRERGYKTVGDFCSMTEAELCSIPVKSPKISRTMKCFKNYENRRKENDGDGIAVSFFSNEPVGESAIADMSTKANVDKDITEVTEADVDNAATEVTESGMDTDTTKVTESDVDKDTTKSSAESSNEAIISFGMDLETEPISNGQFATDAKEPEVSDEVNQSNGLDIDLVEVFSKQIDRNACSVASFADGLSPDTKVKLLESLMSTLPYKKVISLFHNYLSER